LAPFTYIQLQAIKLHALRNYKRESKWTFSRAFRQIEMDTYRDMKLKSSAFDFQQKQYS
jgi:hypothetical protein